MYTCNLRLLELSLGEAELLGPNYLSSDSVGGAVSEAGGNGLDADLSEGDGRSDIWDGSEVL